MDKLTQASVADEVGGIRIVDLTEDAMIDFVTRDYIENIDPDEILDIHKIGSELVHMTNTYVDLHNTQPGYSKWKKLNKLTPQQIAILVLHMENVRMINMGGKENSMQLDHMLLGIYVKDGPNEGIYVTQRRAIEKIILKYDGSITQKDMGQVIKYLEANSRVTERSLNRDLIPVNNGLFDFVTKELLPFSPEHVFVTKCKVNYVAGATAPVITTPDGTTWSVDSWLADLFDYDQGMVTVIWEMLSAVVRNNVNWGKCILLLSTVGCNGKGTLCALMRNLLGHDAYTNLKLAEFGKEFSLEPLLNANAIITDENNNGDFVKYAANLKALITSDTITINRKHKSPIAFQPHITVVQCVNEIPQFADKSGSLARRLCIIPFEKSFTDCERPYIKDDYMGRTEVLQYVLCRVLNMNHYKITETPQMKAALNAFRQFNEPIRDFLEEILPEAVWDFLPQSLLWDMYRAWSLKNNPHGTLPKRKKFFEDLKDIMREKTDWEYKANPVDASKLMVDDEPLLEEYNLKDWYMQYPFDPQQINLSKLRMRHRGYKRITAATATTGAAPATPTTPTAPTAP